MKAYVLGLVVAMLVLVSPAYAYTINGDTITYTGAYGKVTQTPHTLKDLTNTPEINFTSYFSTQQHLDIAFGFDSSAAVPKGASYYNPHWENVSMSYTCNGTFNYTTNPKHFWCYGNVTHPTTFAKTEGIIFEHDYDTGNITTKTAYWKESTFVEWTDITSKFTKINYNYDGKDTWYVIQDVVFNPGETKTIKPLVSVKTNSEGKYDILIKRSSDSIGSGNFVLLDPYWNTTSWLKCINLTVNNTMNAQAMPLYSKLFNITYDSDMQADFDDIRFINESCNNGGTELSYWIEGKVDSSYADVWVRIDNIAASSLRNISMYYNGSMATTSNLNTTFLFGDIDGVTATLNTTKWSIVAGTFNITNGWMYGLRRANADFVRANGTVSNYSNVSIEYLYNFSYTSDVNDWVIGRWQDANNLYRLDDAISTGNLRNVRYVSSTPDVFSQASTTFTNNIVYRMRYDLLGNNITGYKNRALITSGLAGNFSNGAVGLGMYSGTASFFKVKNFFIREIYNITEPTYTLGTEESTAGSGTATSTNLTINGGVGNITHAYTTTADNLTAYVNTTGLGIWIQVNGTNVSTGTTSTTVNYVFPAGFWNVTSYTPGNATYSSSSTTVWATITQVPTAVTLNLDGTQANRSYSYNPAATYNMSGTINVTGLNVELWRNGTLIGNSTNKTEVVSYLNAGLHNVTARFLGNSNYSSSIATWWYNITKLSVNLVMYNNTTGWNITYPLQTTFSGTPNCTALGFTCNLYRNGTLVTNPETTTIGAGAWKYIYNTSGNENYSSNTTGTGAGINELIINQGTPAINITLNTSTTVVEGTIINVVCNKPAELTATLSRNGTSTTNPYVLNTTGMAGTVQNFSCSTPGNDNYTAGSAAWQNITVLVSGSFIIHKAYDETTGANITFNLTVYNSTFSQTYTDLSTYINNSVGGNLTASVSSTGYGTRNYYVDVSLLNPVNISAYLLPDADGQNVLFTAANKNYVAVAGATMTLSKLYGSNWTTVQQGVTDQTGGFVFFLDPDVNYKLLITASGYSNYTTTTMFPLTSYTFYLNSSAGSSVIPSYWSYWKNMTGSCNYTNSTRTLNCTWADTSSSLSLITSNVTKRNTTATVSYCSNTSNATSGSLYCVFLAPKNETYSWVFSTKMTDGTSLILDSGSYTDTKSQSMGNMGLLLAFLVILTCGFVGVQIQSPVITILMTIVGLAMSIVMGLVDFEGAMLTYFMGLVASGIILIYKMR